MKTKHSDILAYIVDDEVEMLKLYEETLTESFNIKTFDHGRDALAAINNHAPDILITDLSMPEIDGIKLIDEVRRSHKNLPIIVVSGYGEQNDMLHLMSLEKIEFLSKPFKLEELTDQTRKLIAAKEETNITPLKVWKSSCGMSIRFNKEGLSNKELQNKLESQLKSLQKIETADFLFDFNRVQDIHPSNVALLKHFFSKLETQDQNYNISCPNEELQQVLRSASSRKSAILQGI